MKMLCCNCMKIIDTDIEKSHQFDDVLLCVDCYIELYSKAESDVEFEEVLSEL